MEFDIYTANVTGEPQNCYYPNCVKVTNIEDLRQAVKNDHVCAKYKGNKRSNDNFECSNVLVMDVDNDVDDKEEFITKEIFEDIFSDINYCLVPSRHNELPKGTYLPAPRFHAIFPIKEVKDVKTYSTLKQKLYALYPFFDGNALDGARFFFGSNAENIIWHDGWLNVDDDLLDMADSDFSRRVQNKIEEGNRNNTMSHYAGQVLKKYGDTDKAHALYLEKANECSPPLDDLELKTIWNSAIKFYENKIKNQADYVQPEDYNKDFENISFIPKVFNDIGEAEVLAEKCKGKLLYTSATDFMAFEGTRWHESKPMAQGVVVRFMQEQLDDAEKQIKKCEDSLIAAGVNAIVVLTRSKELTTLVPKDKLKILDYLLFLDKYKKFVLNNGNYKVFNNVQNTIRSMVAVDVTELDKNPELLNTPKGTINLRKGIESIYTHDPDDLITKITTCSPGLEGKDKWSDALNLFFNKDQDLINYVQEIVGTAAIGKVYGEYMVIAYGGGANGKSTFWNVIARVLGSYAGKISAEALTMSNRRNIKPEIAELKGKRLIIASELEEGTRLNTAMVKQLCSTDEIQAEKKYKDPFHFIPSHTLVLYTNHLPRVSESDNGTWRRLIVIPFNAKITGESDIKNYTDLLYSEAGNYVLTWIIEGAKRAYEKNFHFTLPKSVEDAIAEYKTENDWLGHFLEDYCDIGAGLEEKSGELYKQYRAKCIENGEYIRPQTDFYSSLTKAGFNRHRTNKGSFVMGLKLKDGLEFLD